jgi:2-oxoglutarate ferredoxin oxidoreductase subunit beta
MESMQYAIQKKGFSFVEIMSQCPVSYGKMTGMRDAVSILTHLKETSIHVDDTAGMSEEELEGKIVVGKLVERERSELTESLRELNRGRMVALEKEVGQFASSPRESETEAKE